MKKLINIPDEIMQPLKEKAKANHTDLSKYIVSLLVKAANENEVKKEVR